MNFLTLTNISKTFGNTVAVKDFNIVVEKGEFVSFLGPSGCGKTTTLRMIAGFELPTTGQIVLDGEDITFTPPNRRNVGMVFQSYALFPNLTVAQNIGFGLRVRKMPVQEIDQRVKEMLSLIHLQQFGHRYPYQLSGGQQQRVALARALAIRPRVLLLDEPLSALDAKIRVELRSEIRRIQQQLGITTIYVTHDQEEALSLSDRVVVMKDGLIEQIGTPFEIYNFPQTPFVASFVGTLNVLRAKVLDADKGLLSLEGQTFYSSEPLKQVRNGDVVSVAVRPEIITLVGGGAELNQLNCKVETVTFLGSIVRIQVRIAETMLFFDTFNNPHLVLPQVGAPVTIYFPREACLILGTNA
ncbi:MAG: ABC transporter ATP-binding protein [Anaerolineales bacterium]